MQFVTKSSSQPQNSSSDAFNNLPNHILTEILKRLPLKYLIRLTCVCKSLLSFLTSPIFISAHVLQHDKQQPKSHLLKETFNLHTLTRATSFSLVHKWDLFKNHQISCPLGRNHFVVSSCHGLFCLFDFYCKWVETNPVFLWNPSIKKLLAVPAPFDGFVDFTVGGFPKLVFGCGYDSLSSGYKLVRIAYFCLRGGTCLRTQVYDLGVKRWRSLNMSLMPFKVSTIRWRGLFMNGVIHWVCNGEVSRTILTLKLGNETFGEITLPKVVGEPVNQSTRVVMVPKCANELLGVVHNARSKLSVWVMEQYGVKDSWVKLFNIQPVTTLRNDMNVVVIGEELVVVQLLGRWHSYDGRTSEIKNVMSLNLNLDYVDTYVESLLLFGEKDGVHSDGRKQPLNAVRKRKRLGKFTKPQARAM